MVPSSECTTQSPGGGGILFVEVAMEVSTANRDGHVDTPGKRFMNARDLGANLDPYRNCLPSKRRAAKGMDCENMPEYVAPGLSGQDRPDVVQIPYVPISPRGSKDSLIYPPPALMSGVTVKETFSVLPGMTGSGA